MGCGASHERAEPMVGSAGLVPIVPTGASTPVAASEKVVTEVEEARAAAVAERAAAERAAAERAAVEKAPAEFERQLAKARAAQEAPTNAALRFGQQFEMTGTSTL